MITTLRMPLVERVGSPAGIGGDAYSSRGELLIAEPGCLRRIEVQCAS
jgi:hypothetical protein